jgi:AAA domain/Protein of unknown function (DUF669)
MNLAGVHKFTAQLAPRILIHGAEGVGKTTIASKFPTPIFLQTEDGCPSGLEIDSFGLIDNFADLRSAIGALASEQHHYQTVVIDSLDATEELIWHDTCRSQGWSSIESPGYGKGYVIVGSWWIDILKGLDFLRRRIGMSVLLLAHSAIETINDPRAASYTSYQLRLHKRARGLVQDWCDAIGFLAPDLHVQSEEVGFGKKRNRADGGSQRWLHFEARPSFVAKNRYDLPAKMPVPKNFSYGRSLRTCHRSRRRLSMANPTTNPPNRGDDPMSTQFPETFDPTTQEGNSWDVLPVREYVAQAVEASIQQPNSGDGYYLALTWKIIEGDYEGRQVWQRITYLHSSEQAQTIGRKMLKDLCVATGVAEQVDDAEVFLFKPVRIRLGIERDKQGVYPDKNRISRILPLEAKSEEPEQPEQPAKPGAATRVASAAKAPKPAPAGPAPWHAQR